MTFIQLPCTSRCHDNVHSNQFTKAHPYASYVHLIFVIHVHPSHYICPPHNHLSSSTSTQAFALRSCPPFISSAIFLLHSSTSSGAGAASLLLPPKPTITHHIQKYSSIRPYIHLCCAWPTIYCHDTIHAQIFVALSSLVAFLAASPALLPKAANAS